MMDSEIKDLIALAKKRGSQYIKKKYSPDEFGEQMAELGVYLLAEYDRINALQEEAKRIEELNELHQRIDHFRQAIFSLKRKIME
jgi:hypothetical protein